MDHLQENQDAQSILLEELLRTRPEGTLDLDYLHGFCRWFADHIKGFEGKDALRVWFAGCGTGEQVYLMASLMKATLKKVLSDVPTLKIIASDISENALKTARLASISQDLFIDFPEKILDAHFDRHGEESSCETNPSKRYSVCPPRHRQRCTISRY